jgi:UDP-glucuronate 4-epimerase
MHVLVTGAAGFIGFHTARVLLERGDTVVGLDNIDDYYDVSLKHARLDRLAAFPNFRFVKADLADRTVIADLFATERPQRVVHLAAQPGVRYAFDHPHAYADANLVGFLSILEGCRHATVEHLLYASSSSVYGANTAMPYAVHQNVDHPLSLYGATKKANELMAHSYAHLFQLPVTGLRFFTVYGPWGRPDMAMWIFTKALYEGQPLQIFNGGDMRRDFTYIDDIVSGVLACLDGPPKDDGEEKAGGSRSPHAVYNIGNHRSEELMRMIGLLERATGRSAAISCQPMQPGDVKDTFADISAIQRDHGFEPSTAIDEGVPHFVDWFKQYHRID